MMAGTHPHSLMHNKIACMHASAPHMSGLRTAFSEAGFRVMSGDLKPESRVLLHIAAGVLGNVDIECGQCQA